LTTDKSRNQQILSVLSQLWAKCNPHGFFKLYPLFR